MAESEVNYDALVEAPKPKQDAPPQDVAVDYDSLVPDRPPVQALKQSVAVAADKNPDQYAKVIDLAKKTNLPPEHVERNYDDVKKEHEQDSVDYNAIVNDSPKTAAFASDPDRAAVVKDDLPHLGAIESTVKAHSVFDSLVAGYQNSTLGLAIRRKMPDIGVPEDAPISQRIASQIATLAGDFPAMILGGAAGGAAGAVAGATGGAVAGSVVPGVGTIAGGGVGGILGAAGGSSAGAFAAPSAIRKALMDEFQKGDIKTVGEFWTRAHDVAVEAVKSGTIGLATAGAAGAVGGLLAKTAAPAVVTGVAKVGAEVGAMTGADAAINHRPVTSQEIVDNLLMVGALHGTGAVLAKAGEARQARLDSAAAEQNKAAYVQLEKQVSESKTHARSPETSGDHLEAVTKGTPMETINVDPAGVETYFQSKNINAAAALASVGVTPEQFAEAKQTGTLIRIPVKAWAEKVVGTEHAKGLADHVTFDPEGKTVAQAKEQEAVLGDAADHVAEAVKTAQTAQEQSAATRADLEQRIYNNIKDQKPEGMTAKEWKSNAAATSKLWASMISTQAEQAGVHPDEILSQMPTKLDVGNGHLVDFTPMVERPSGAYDPQALSQLRADMERARDTFEKGGLKKDENGDVIGKYGATSAAPDYFKGSGYSPKEVLKILDKHANGEDLTAGQRATLEDVLHSSGYDKRFNERVAQDAMFQTRKERAAEMGFDTSKVWYHGTPNGKLSEFDPHMSPREIRVAGFFTEDKEFAREFASGDQVPYAAVDSAKPFIHKVHLRTENTFDFDQSKHVDQVMKNLDAAAIKKIAKGQSHINGKEISKNEIRQQIGLGNWTMLEDPTVFKAVKAAGFDSMYVHEKGQKNIAVFNPEHIRSINAEFDPANADSPNIYSQTRKSDFQTPKALRAYVEEKAPKQAVFVVPAKELDGKAAQYDPVSKHLLVSDALTHKEQVDHVLEQAKAQKPAEVSGKVTAEVNGKEVKVDAAKAARAAAREIVNLRKLLDCVAL